MDEADVERAIVRIAHQIVERNHGIENLCIMGIRTHGVPIAARLQKEIEAIEGRPLELGTLDISLYRDDISGIPAKKAEKGIKISFSIVDKIVVLVDDVIFTGRTARAAMDAIMAEGRAAKIQLAVMVDRGHRELPIRPDFVGKNIPTSRDEFVKVHLKECDGDTCVQLYEKAPA